MTTTAQQPLRINALGRTAAVSPLRYPGGKAALAPFFGDVISRLGIGRHRQGAPQPHGRMTGECAGLTPVGLAPIRYVEPYAGGAGAGMVLLLQDRVDEVVINDVDPAVYAFWTSMLRQPDAFAALIEDTPLTVAHWRHQKAVYRAANESDPLALGFAFFYLNRTNRSGILNAGPIGGVDQSGNYKIDARFNRSQLAQRVSALGSLASRITVCNLDGMAIVRRYANDSSAFIYVDPPYVTKGGSLYLNAFTHRDHSDLATELTRATRGNWILTYDMSDFIRKLYAAHHVREYELSYSAHRAGKARELLVASPSISRVLATD